MSGQHRAVVDLGSNTFHVLIAEITPTFNIVRKERYYVHLGEGGLGIIKNSAIDRALTALKEIKLIIAEYAVESIQCFGTAALRSAKNGQEFVDLVHVQLGLKIVIIDGEREARLIYQGVAALNPFHQDIGLIMDIGGGSVEFIIADVNGLIWCKSYNIGILVLYNKFHQEDPMLDTTLEDMRTFLKHIFQDLLDQLEKHKPSFLIGASGTFDVLKDAQQSDDLLVDIPIPFLTNLLSEVQHFSYEQRLAHHLLPEKRARYMVEALSLVQIILELHTFSALRVSAYALKEGALLYPAKT